MTLAKASESNLPAEGTSKPIQFPCPPFLDRSFLLGLTHKGRCQFAGLPQAIPDLWLPHNAKGSRVVKGLLGGSEGEENASLPDHLINSSFCGQHPLPGPVSKEEAAWFEFYLYHTVFTE